MSNDNKKKKKLGYAMSLAALEELCLEAEEEMSIYSDLIKDYLSKDAKLVSKAVLSSLCQGYTLCYQMHDAASTALEEPVFLKDSKEKIIVVEEDMYLIETIALSKIYCENQLKKLSISTKMN